MHDRLEPHWLACMAALGGGRVTRTEGAVVVASPTLPGRLANFIALKDSKPERLARTLELGAALLSAAGRPPVAYLSPLSGNVAELAAALAQEGWIRTLRQAVLVRDLSQPMEAAPDITVHEVAGDQSSRWQETLAAAAGVEPEVAAAWAGLTRAPGAHSQARLYLAELNGRAVGTGLAWTQGEIAGLFCGAVLPAFRRRGVERATLQRRLADARHTGARYALVQTEESSPVQHLCENRLGFALAYCRDVWVPPVIYAQR